MSLVYLLLAAPVAQALRYDPAYAEYNLNTNQQAVSPLDYSGERNAHVYHPSPENWRFPFYTVMLDKWVNGDPSNEARFSSKIYGARSLGMVVIFKAWSIPWTM
jgi:alpha-1,3-glucan synthase